LRQVPDIRVADLRRFTADCTDERSQRIQRNARFNSVGFAQKFRPRLEQPALRHERNYGDADWFALEHRTEHRRAK
jgi:hypothetical protein